ncbi:MAG: hypothetical protein CMM61_11545 [Rhodospirillaceae bacterium]|nr:hypothetical protein [Rhodospirillaceae bacterium]
MRAADEFIVRMAEGIIGWFSYQQAASRSAVYSEYLFYPPMFELGHGRGWTVTCQKQLADNARQTYDMQFRNSKKSAAIGLEAKFIKLKKPFTGKIQNDLRKLHKVKTDVANHPPGLNMVVYELIVGHVENIESAIDKVEPLKKVWGELWDNRPDGKFRRGHPGWLFHGQGEERFRYSVAVFRYQPTWDLGGDFEPEEQETDEPINFGEWEE